MTAWRNLVDYDGSDEYLELLSAAMVEVQTETRQKYIRKILATNPDRDADFSAGVDWAVSVLGEGL